MAGLSKIGGRKVICSGVLIGTQDEVATIKIFDDEECYVKFSVSIETNRQAETSIIKKNNIFFVKLHTGFAENLSTVNLSSIEIRSPKDQLLYFNYSLSFVGTADNFAFFGNYIITDAREE